MCVFSLCKILGILGLLLNILGTILILYDNQKTFNKMSNLLKEVSENIGYWVDDPIDNVKISSFNNTIINSIKYQKRGFILLVLGFIIQFISYLL